MFVTVSLVFKHIPIHTTAHSHQPPKPHPPWTPSPSNTLPVTPQTIVRLDQKLL